MPAPDQQPGFEERKSQNLHFSDFAKSTLLWGFLPIIAGLATFTGGRISKKYFNNKLWPLDGSPTIVMSLYEKGASLVSHKTLGKKIALEETERLASITHFWPEEKRLGVTRDIWNFLKGTEIGIVLTAFHFWRHKEGKRLDLQPSYDRLKKLEGMNPTNAELRQENRAMEQELVYLEAKQAKSMPTRITSQHLYEGKPLEMAAEQQR